METITAYKTSDGSVFTDMEKANAYEKRHKISEELFELMRSSDFDYLISEDVVDFIFENRDSIISILK